MSRAKTVDGFIAELPADQQEIVSALREVIRRTAPGLQETLKWGMPCYVGDGNVCGIVPYKNHVNLAFHRGTELRDKDGLLEGIGKGMRRVKVASVKGLRRPAVAALVREAARLDGM